jgi:hypothetical protein
VSPEVYEALQRTRSRVIEALAGETRRRITVEADPGLPGDGWAVETG